MTIAFVGSNPGVLLYDAGGPSSFVSVFVVDYSPAGRGSGLVVVDRTGWRTFGPDRELMDWLVDTLVRWFPEVATFASPFPDLVWHDTVLDVRLDASGMTATCDDLVVEIGNPLHLVEIDRDFALGDRGARLRNVYIPCGTATLAIDGVRRSGRLVTDGSSSTAYLALAEVWSIPDD